MFRPWHIFILAALIVVCPQSRSSATEVDNIWIVSTQTGPTSMSSNLLIVRKGNEYFADHYRLSLLDLVARGPDLFDRRLAQGKYPVPGLKGYRPGVFHVGENLRRHRVAVDLAVREGKDVDLPGFFRELITNKRGPLVHQ